MCLGPLVAKPRIKMDRNLGCELLLPSGTYVQSFGSIAPAVTERTLLTDDDNGRHMIAWAHPVDSFPTHLLRFLLL
jgi:hypothetical protein